jgi:hypothetical protein
MCLRRFPACWLPGSGSRRRPGYVRSISASMPMSTARSVRSSSHSISSRSKVCPSSTAAVGQLTVLHRWQYGPLDHRSGREGRSMKRTVALLTVAAFVMPADRQRDPRVRRSKPERELSGHGRLHGNGQLRGGSKSRYLARSHQRVRAGGGNDPSRRLQRLRARARRKRGSLLRLSRPDQTSAKRPVRSRAGRFAFSSSVDRASRLGPRG